MSTIYSPAAHRIAPCPGAALLQPSRRPATDKRRGYFCWKGLVDRLLAALLLIPGFPLIGLLVLLVRLTSRGPGIFRQIRVGRDGKTFMMYKIRTMRLDAETGTGAVWAGGQDPRITRLGRVLRNFHLDELPQLFNVLRGDMSLVGPRPERPEFVRVLAEAIPGYEGRLVVPPGVTGLAQINLPPDADLNSVRRKLMLDLEYVREAGFWLDCRVLLCTLVHLLGISGPCSVRLMRLERSVPLEDIPDTNQPGPEDTAEAGAVATPERIAQQAGLADEKASEDRETARRPSSGVRSPLLRQQSASAERVQETFSLDDLAGAFTVDVEDYFQVTAFEDDIPRDRWQQFDSHVVANTQRILELLASYEVHGTFFVLGWTAERYPRLVEEIHAAGHQIGSHGYWHRRIYEQKPEEFRRDLQRSRDVLTDIIGQKVTAYRAPCFSVTKQSLWALDILAEEGFEADCSIFPIRHDRYGIPEAEQRPHRIATSAGLLWELPPATRRLAGLNVPVAGGGYFRLFPAWWTIRSLKVARWRLSRPFIFYVHPWELDAAQPRLDAGTWISRLRHYVNLAATEGKLDALLKEFCFGRLDQLMEKLHPPPECRFAAHESSPLARPLRPAERAQHLVNGHPAFRRSPRCITCSWNLCREPNGKCRCRAPVYELANSP